MSLTTATLKKTTKATISHELQQAIRAAAQWHVKLNATDNSANNSDANNSANSDAATQQAQLQEQWQQWLSESKHHQNAWQQIENLLGKFNQLPTNISAGILEKSELSRRELLTRLASVVGIAPVGWLSYQYLPWQTWQADYHTAIGESQKIALPDGGLLILNTNSAVDIIYDEKQRLVYLHQGEVIIHTAKDSSNRPFYVNTQHGSIQALGTQFIVRTNAEHSLVTVLEKSVRIKPALANNKTSLVNAKEQLSFTRYNHSAITTADKYATSWVNGSLVVVDMPLGLLISELSRYRSGVLSCDENIAHHKVSGAFPLANTELALEAITNSFPVRQRRFSRYWVKIIAK